VAKQKSLLNLM